MAAKFIVLIVHLWSISFFCFLKSEEVTTKNYLDDFLKWFEDHGGRCRCKFTEAKDKTLTAISDRKIVDKESILMVPQSIVVNFTVIESSMIGPTLEQLSLTDNQITKVQDYIQQQAFHLLQMAVFVLYSTHTRNEQWLPYFNVLLKYDCDALWMWSENELKEVQDENLAKRAIEWKELISTVADKIIPKLNNFGLFTGNDLDSETLVKTVCAVQKSSVNVTSDSGHPVRTLVPGLNMFTYQPSVSGMWWTNGGALQYAYVNSTVEKGNTIYFNMNPSGDSIQTLFEYGVFNATGSKFFTPLPKLNSRMRRRLAAMLKLKTRIKYCDKFTFKAAGLPHFRVQALSEENVNELVRVGSNAEKLFELKKIFNSPSLHTQSNAFYSCKDEVVALNLLSLHLRDEMSGRSTGMPQDEDILLQEIPKRQRMAVEFRLRYKRLVSNYLDITSARAIETKRECLSRKRDEL